MTSDTDELDQLRQELSFRRETEAEFEKLEAERKAAEEIAEREWHRRQSEDRWLRVIGYATRPLVYLAVLALLYFNVPSISDRPLGSLTVNEIFVAASWAVFIIVWFYAFFNYSGEEINWELWGSFGMILVGGGLLLWMFA